MSALFNAAGARLKAADVATTTSTVTFVTITEDVFERRPYGPFDADPAGDKVTRKFKPGDTLTQAEFDALFPDPVFTSIAPTSGAAGTAVTIKGANLDGVTGVTFDGVAATNVKVVDAETVTCTTPAGAAGPADVVITDDGGNVTAVGAYTYV